MEAIESSRIVIIIFSKNYASSTWCLSELVKILDYKKHGQIEKVLPVFYKLDPSDVRHQHNTYAEAFKKHEERFKKERKKVETWRSALTEAANLAGWDQRNVANGHEAELTKIIVAEVWGIVNKLGLHVADHPIGLDPHIEHIKCLLDDGGLGVVRIIGIYGLGGIGKTTIVKAVFNIMFADFEGSIFLADVREGSKQNGLALLQEQLLSGVLKRKEIHIHNEDEGINIIKERLSCKRVLIVLDDLEETNHFYKLVGGHECLGLGSRIIVTTRDKHLLDSLDVDKKYKYKVETMSPNESLQLFSSHAFQQKHPLEDYVQLSNDVICYSGGLPLALVVLGSLLYKRSKVEWESELNKLRKIPNGQILEKLEISYDALDDFSQTIFLDISCFFIGKVKKFVITILDACGLGGEARIKLLTERSLLTIDESNTLCMHDLIQDMGREIVRKQSPGKLGGRSRLWDIDDAIDVLINLTGTDMVKGLQLHIDNFDVKDLGNLVILEMQDSVLKEVWKGTKYLTKLKELNLSGSWSLTYTPDFSGLPNLEKLILNHCRSLIGIHGSIKCLKKLVNLDLSMCENLKNLPSGISYCSKLETLNVWNCYRLNSLPMLPSSLRSLNASGCVELKWLPNMSNLRDLKMLDLTCCNKLIEIECFQALKSATTINLDECFNLKSSAKKIIFQ
ncbi:TMV resistance protein N-like, partial [Macadamia integrifolia]|uniref:TMV resistance protein N-like n=1 Tax=Macadamia integrifolia TaxID=60698 RepID=UPI001C4FFD0D